MMIGMMKKFISIHVLMFLVLLSFSGCGDRKRIENSNALTTNVSSNIEKVGGDDRTNQVNKEEKRKFWSIASNPVFLVTGLLERLS
jgi:hypothetical protein